jgi:alkanesulfonate monooxygenase SsuD/methylene tetrahydromethanopterin reductase-like flavin-dependent oxidoreductase (luciferase family)
MTSRPLTRLGFLTIGLFDPADPAAGHEETLRIIEIAEGLGFDSAWLRHRHLQHGISSPIAVMAAATQRTTRIELGTAVTPLGAENPFRLAEDLGTVDVLSRGRLNPGLSAGPPMNYDRYKEALYPDTFEIEELGYPRMERLLANLRGEPVSEFEGTVGIETYSKMIQPHVPGLVDRVWLGAGSMRSVEWAAAHGLNLLTSSVLTSVPESDVYDFGVVQASQIERFRELHPAGEQARVSQGLVVIPTDGATPEQTRRYHEYAASRFERTLSPQGPGRLLFAPDLVGTSEEVAERLIAHPAFAQVEEVAFALPFTFGFDDYVQILTDMATNLAPLLGWSPSA